METSKTLAVDTLQRVLMPKKGEPHDVRMLYLIEQEHNKQRLRWSDRTSFEVPAGNEVSFETYFNACLLYTSPSPRDRG